MKRKALCFVLTLLVMAVFSLVGCGGGGGHSNPASSNIAGTARVSGVVVDSSNNPVPNAKVRLVLASKALVNSLINNISSTSRLATNDNQNEFTTNTDNKGQYTFVNVPYGEYTLSALTADRAQIVTRLTVNAAEIDTDKIVLAPFGSIDGFVTNSSDYAIEGALVYIEGTSYCAITDSNGEYRLTNVPVNTEFTLCAMANGYDLLSRKATITSSESLELNTDNAFETVKFNLSSSTQKAAIVKCSISGDGANLNNLLVLAVSDDGKNAYVAQVLSGVATIYITTPGNYSIIPASLYDGTNVAGTSQTLEISGKEIQNNENKTITLSIGKPAYGGSPAYATLSGSIDNKNTSDTQFEVHLIDETGHDRKLIKTSNDLNFTFNNVPDGNYKIIVCSDNSLFVSSNYGISDGKGLEITSPLTPVVVTPEVSLSNGSATVRIVNSPFIYDNNLASFSVYGFDKSSNPILLYRNEDGKVDLSVYEFSAKAGTEANVSLDNLSADSTLGGIKFIYRNETDYRSDKPIFEKMYAFNKGKPDYRTIYLGTKGSLKLSNNVILFKAVTYQSNLYYLVVTTNESANDDPTEVIVFDSKGEQKGSIHLSAPVTYGNACFVKNEDDPFLIAQYKGGSDLRMEKHLFSNILTSKYVNDSSFQEPRITTGGYYQPDSINKVLATSDGKIFSVCDSFVLIYDPSVVGDSSWTQIGFGTSNRTVAPFSTIVPSSDNNHKIFYINHEDNGACAGYKAYLGVSEFDADNTSTTVKYNYEIGEFHLYYGNTSNCNTGSTRIGSNDYSYYILFDNTGYPFSLSDCLDNLEATNKVFIPNGYNWNNGTKLPTINSELVFSNTIYSATNIESSFINAGYNFETWIERKPNEQFLVLRNTNSYKENKILINQVFNSSAYLESSIGYSTVNGEQVHVICADSDNNIQVMVLNCIDPDHKN